MLMEFLHNLFWCPLTTFGVEPSLGSQFLRSYRLREVCHFAPGYGSVELKGLVSNIEGCIPASYEESGGKGGGGSRPIIPRIRVGWSQSVLAHRLANDGETYA